MTEKNRQKLSAKLSKVPAESKKGGIRGGCFSFTFLISTHAYRGRWKRMEADNEKWA